MDGSQKHKAELKKQIAEWDMEYDAFIHGLKADTTLHIFVDLCLWKIDWKDIQ